jgi:hypothetical protein
MNGTRQIVAASTFLIFSALGGAMQPAPPSWSRQGEIKPERAGLTEVTIPLPLLDHASPTLHDLRLFKTSGEEIPYSLHQPSRTPAQWISAESFESVMDHKNTVLFGKAPNGAVDALRLESPAGTFLKSVSLDVFEKGHWRTLWKGRPIYRTSPGVQNLELEFPARRLNRFRLLVDDQKNDPIAFTGIAVRMAIDSVPAIEKIPAVQLEREEHPWDTHLTLGLPSQNLFVDGLTIETSNSHFQRSVRVVLQDLSPASNSDFGQHITEVLVGESTLYRSPGENGTISENLFIPINRRIPGRKIHLMVENGDAPPLEIKSVKVHHIPTRLLFFATDMNPITFAAGHPSAPVPHYDWPLTRAIPVPAQVANVQANPNDVKPDVAPLMASVGAAFDGKGWVHRSAVHMKSSGVQSLEIPFSVLVCSSWDGRDVRLVRDGKQLPFIYDRGVPPQTIIPERSIVPTAPKGISRWELKLPTKGIPISNLDIRAKESLFRRPVHIYEERFTANGVPYRHSFSNTQWVREGNGEGRLLIFFAGFPQNDRIYLEIEDGDNAPLTIEDLKLYYRTYSIVFKTDLGAPLWLYYGQPDVRFPIYDAALVADELLSAEKSKAVLGAEEKQKSRWVWGSPRNGETSALFWIVLIAVTLMILLVIQRLLPMGKDKF